MLDEALQCNPDPSGRASRLLRSVAQLCFQHIICVQIQIFIYSINLKLFSHKEESIINIQTVTLSISSGD